MQIRPGQYIKCKYACWAFGGEHRCVIEAFFHENALRDLRWLNPFLSEADRKRTYHNQVFPLHIGAKARQISAKYLC